MPRRCSTTAPASVSALRRCDVFAPQGAACNTLMDTVTNVGAIMINHADRIRTGAQLGVDEAVFSLGWPKQATPLTRRHQFVSSVTDVKARCALGVSRTRQPADRVARFGDRPPARFWVSRLLLAELHEPFRAAIDESVPDAVQVAAGFTNLTHSRTRILLAIGGCN